VWALAGAALLADPARPAASWAIADAVLLGAVAGGTLYRVLAGAPRLLTSAAAATLVVAAGAEEVLWRWLALGELAGRIGPLPALAATSAGFGLVHRGARVQHAATGLLFGGVYLGTGSLAGAWCAHATYNLSVAAAAAARRAPPEPA
jgi:membrane protease YdiL (CAAX protease family)